MIKIYLMICIPLCYLYPAIELTRLILQNGAIRPMGFPVDYIFEIAVIWLLYMAGILFVILLWRVAMEKRYCPHCGIKVRTKEKQKKVLMGILVEERCVHCNRRLGAELILVDKEGHVDEQTVQ